MAASQPERQMPPGGVSERERMIQREVVLRREDAQKIGGGSHILKCSRPATAWLARAAILDIPGGEARRCQRGAGMAKVVQIVANAPVAAVNANHDGMRPLASGHAQIAELPRLRAIGNALARIRQFALKNVLAHSASMIWLHTVDTTYDQATGSPGATCSVRSRSYVTIPGPPPFMWRT